MTDKISISTKDLNALGEALKTANEIFNRYGFNLDGDASERRAIRKEPSQKQKVNNYAEILDLGKKYSKPKHLKK